MRLILEPKSMEGIEEKLLKSRSQNRAKNTSKNLENEKHCSSTREMNQPKKTAILMQTMSLQGMETNQISSCSMEDWRDLSLFSSFL
jgi:hypothetical protein